MSRPREQLTVQDIAELAGIATNTVYVHRTRGTIPEPDGYLGPTAWWWRETVEDWLDTRRQPGWPRKGQT